MKRLSLLWLFAGVCTTAHAGPQINVGTVYDYLDGSKSTYLKRVFNSGDSTAFVKVNVLEIVYEADGTPKEIPVEASADGTSRNGLMASPARLIIPAEGMQGTRLLYMGERERERYFRVRFVPVVPEKEDDFVVSSEERENYKKTLSAGVNVMTGFGTVFFVRPLNARYDTQINDSASRYEVKNNGNTVLVVDEFKSCSLTDETDCGATVKHHVLAGRTFGFDKEQGREYRFKLVEGERRQDLKVVSR
ncbi:molecular chaperone [Pseudomonas botevensis]|uniref:molecular chaperone n=1 Tax=Pseudomonas botevensis TaxID=2842352 RepID=UPI001C3C23CE|nr:molecular chaperone [Pseudomonas botevensis]MBV4477097.1 molecular chaperone [Pseudomonas botevensis]